MELNDVIQFANQNPVASIATVEGNQPRVRLFAMWFADPTGFYFHTGSMKNIYKQLKANPKIEVAFYKPGAAPSDPGRMMRVSGAVEFVNDKKLEERLMNDRPFLKEIKKNAPAGSNLEIIIFRIAKGTAVSWTMADNLNQANAPKCVF